MQYDNCGTPEKPSWREELIKQAEKLLQDAREVRELVENKTGSIVGYEPAKPEGTEKLQNTCFQQNMADILLQIAVIGKEIKHQIERL